jgi:hypothetical protein
MDEVTLESRRASGSLLTDGENRLAAGDGAVKLSGPMTEGEAVPGQTRRPPQ